MVMAEADVASAFDSIGIPEIEHVLEYWHLHPRVVAAILHELHDLSCDACLADVFTRRRIFFNSCIRQGSSESPWLWNAVMRYVFVKSQSSWGQQNAGIMLDSGVLLTHIGWSDNVWLFARNETALASMMQALTPVLDHLSLYWKPSSLKVMGPKVLPGQVVFSISTSRPLGRRRLQDLETSMQAFETLPVISVAHMDILGTRQSRLGETCIAVDHRLQKGTAAFWANKDLFMCRSVCLKVRLQELTRRVIPVALFGSGAWVWSRALVLRVRAWERSLLRRVVGIKRKPGELFVDFVKRSTRVSERLSVQHGYRHCLCVLAWNIHSLAGRILQIPGDAPPTLKLAAATVETRHMLQWEFSRALAQIASGSNTPDSFRHAGRGRPRFLWENNFVRVFGADWQSLARMGTWKSTFGTFKDKLFREFGIHHPVKKPLRNAMPDVIRQRDDPEPLRIPWSIAHDGCVRVLFGSDSKVVAKWCAGEWMPKYKVYSEVVNSVHNLFAAHLRTTPLARGAPTLRPPAYFWNFWAHQYREYNILADNLAKQAALGITSLRWHSHVPNARYLWAQMDGSLSPDGAGSSAAMWAATDLPSPSWVGAEWELVAEASLQIRAETVVQTELVAALLALCLVMHFLNPQQSFSLTDLHGGHAMAVASFLQSTFLQGHEDIVK